MATDFSKIFGGSILSFVEETIGPIIDADKPFSLNPKAKVKAYVAQVRKNPEYKVLFTLGLFAYHRKECFICLHSAWPLPHYYFQINLLSKNLTDAPYLPETLPLDMLSGLVASSIRKNTNFQITEGVFLDKNKSPWSKYAWPEELFGMTLIDYYWNTPEGEATDDIDDSMVRLYTLASVKTGKKSLSPEWYQQRRHSGWEEFVLPIFSDIPLVTEMNQAILDKNWSKAKELVAAGININRGVYDNHFQWGDIVTHTYLEHVMMYESEFDMVKFLVDHGARVSPDTLSMIAGHATIEMCDYFLNLGCDVNAIDNVGYSAMNRALAFDNTPLVEYLKTLGCKYRVQRNDKEEKLAELSNMGIEIVGA